jgi:Condensation domain/TubC N-terminal docking domain
VTTHELLAELRALDVHVHAEGGRLRVNAPKGRMTPALEAALVAGKAELLRVLEERGADAAAQPARPALVPARRDDGALPLSFLQERLWLVDRLQPGGTAYNLASMLAPDEPMDSAFVEQAVRRVVARHEILRSRFVLDGEAPAVRVGAAEDVRTIVRDLRASSDEARRATLAGALEVAVHEPFDLETEAPIRFTIFRLPDDRAALLVCAHHIALDSWSFALLTRELRREYDAVARGIPAEPAPTLQYVDFAHWQRRMMALPSAETRLGYWTGRLAGLPQLSTFPPDRPRALDGMTSGANLDFRWPAELVDAARGLARGWTRRCTWCCWPP